MSSSQTFSFPFSRAKSGRGTVNDVALPGYGLIFLNHLVGEFDSCNASAPADPEAYARAKSLKEVYLQGSRVVTWGDLYAFERDVVRLTTGQELKERLWSVEKRFLAIGTLTDYAEHAKNLPLVLETADDENIRARIGALLRELYRLYTVTACRESMRNRASKIVTWIMLTFLCLMFIPQAIHDIGTGFSNLNITTILAVMSAGAVGGFVSAQRRVQSVSNRGESMLDLIELSTLTGTLLAPITGAVFASVLFMMFTGTLISGELFPIIATPKDPVAGGMILDAFSHGTGPSTGSDWAKLLVWSFIAGFAERFVPDALDRLVSRAERKPG
jgi:hypothetical protein